MGRTQPVVVILKFVLALWMCLSCFTACADLEESRCLLGPKAGRLTVKPGMDASGRDLRGSVFIGLDLKGAVFDGCELENVKFYQCDLQNASFKGTRLTGMALGDCDLRGADLTDAIVNGIRPVHGHQGVTGSLLRSTRSYKWGDLTDCVIRVEPTDEGGPFELDFRKKRLDDVEISGDLRACRFDDASIERIALAVCQMEFNQFASTKTYEENRLSGIEFWNVRFGGACDFSGMNLRSCKFLEVHSTGATEMDFTDADIGGCTFRESITKPQLASTRSYREGRLCEIQFRAMNLRSFDFSCVNLTGAGFAGCDLTLAKFDDAVITNVDFVNPAFRPTLGLTADQIKSTWNYRHGRMEGIVLPEEIADRLNDGVAQQIE